MTRTLARWNPRRCSPPLERGRCMVPGFMFLCLAGIGTTALAQGVGVGSPTETTHALTHVFSIPENPINWNGQVGTTDNPLGVSLDPSGPVWTKSFEPEGSLAPLNNIVLLREYLLIAGDKSWTGWHMSIETEGFDWYSQYIPFQFVLRANGSNVSGAQISLLPDRAIQFSFPELVPGTAVEIGVKMSYNGGDPFADAVHVQQYPTPEPMTFGFLFLSFLAFVGRRPTHAKTTRRSWCDLSLSRRLSGTVPGARL